MEISGITQHVNDDMPLSGPVFSYAQAAKGRSPSVSHVATKSETLDVRVKSMPQPSKDWAEESEFQSTENDSEQKNLKIADANTPLPQPSPAVVQNTIPTTPSSPDLSTVSTSTLPKEDDLFMTTNGSSDSTWDKQSQTSQNAEKIMNKHEAEKEDAKSSVWDQPSSTTYLKEASPPTVNVWQQRALEKQAKASKESKAMHPAAINFNEKNIVPASSNKTAAEIGLAKAETIKNGNQSFLGGEEFISVGAVQGRPAKEEGVSSSTKRGIRSLEAGKGNSAAPPLPPLAGDAFSWPTPDNAQGEEKRRNHDRGERPDKNEKEKVSTTKIHGKEKWVPVPYVPNAVFNTPLPPGRRGGRLSRGGREGNGRGGHVSYGSIGGEKQVTNTANHAVSPANLGNEHGKSDMGPPRGGATCTRPKRSASAGPPAARDSRKSSDGGVQEKRNDPSSLEQRFAYNYRPTPGDGRRTSIATQTENVIGGRQLSPPIIKGSMQPPRKPIQNTMDHEDRVKGQHEYTSSRPNAVERRSEGSMRTTEFREINGFFYPRERGEGRSDRGRGSYRGTRGGMNGFNSSHSANGNNFSNGHGTHSSASGFATSKSHSSNERHSQTSQGAQFSIPHRESRAYRTNSRSQSIPNPAQTYGRYPSGNSSGNQQLPAIQTQLANMYGYEPGHSGVLSAFPYHPHMEQMQLLGMVQMQMEYYFSVDNLCKDMFLRKHMDSQGYVFLSILANFNRIKQLTSDTDIIRYVCLHSHSIEFQTGTDGIDRVRKADGWQQWILSIDERDETAKNDGPVQMQQLRFPPTQLLEGPPGSSSRGDVLWRGPFGTTVSHGEDNTIPSSDRPSAHTSDALRKLSNEYMTDAPVTQTPLSAAVPDFAPGVPILGSKKLTPVENCASKENYFSDEQVESLMIVVRKPILATASLRPPMSLATSRTFSNGSIDGRTLSAESMDQEDSQPAASVDGDGNIESVQAREPDTSHSSRSPTTTVGLMARATHSLPIFWVKHEESPIGDLPPDLTHISYTVFRRNALKERDQAQVGQCPRDMDILYQFWSHFLIRNFNPSMYQEFRHLSFEDSTDRGTNVGIKNLVQYYDESILGSRVISNELARDYADLVKTELSRNERPAFDKLRAAWRNGAFNMRNRSKMDKILDGKLKAQLEQ